MHDLVGRIDESKFKMDVCRQVFDAWVEAAKPILAKENVTAVLFWYDERRWRGTIKRETSLHNGQEVTFINIKLPNDGPIFMDASTYVKNTAELNETEDTNSFVYHVHDTILGAFPDFFNSAADLEVEAIYDPYQQRVALYFWEPDSRSRCVTVKFEYGYHQGTTSIGKRQFTTRIKKTYT